MKTSGGFRGHACRRVYVAFLTFPCGNYSQFVKYFILINSHTNSRNQVRVILLVPILTLSKVNYLFWTRLGV